MSSKVLLVQKEVPHVRMQEFPKLHLGPFALSMTLCELRKWGFCFLQDLHEAVSRKDWFRIFRLASSRSTNIKIVITIIPIIATHYFDVHGGKLGGNRHSRPGIPSSIRNLIVREGKLRPIAGTIDLVLGQIDTQNRSTETL